MEPQISNPNDHKVVSFHNNTDFGFTPEMGCMYGGRAINGLKGSPGIDAGETVVLPYHVANQLALNLAKIAITKSAPNTETIGAPVVPLWDDVRLNKLKQSYLEDLYTEEKPVAMSETDKLLAKVEELNKFVRENIPDKQETPTISNNGYQDKAEVIAELTKRDIKFDARQSKDTLEKLLA